MVNETTLSRPARADTDPVSVCVDSAISALR